MKNKRIVFLFILCALLLIAQTHVVKASDSISTGSDSYTEFEFTTTIERWSPANDLLFVKEDDWSDSWYTKRVYLRGQYESRDVEYEIEDNDFTYSNGDYVLALGASNEFNFDLGSSVYLVEKYDVSGLIDYSSDFLVGGTNENYSLSTNDHLVLDIDDSDIVDASMENYNPTSSSETLYIQAEFKSSTPDTENRDKNIYIFMKDSNDSKTNTKNQGTINLPIFKVNMECSATGNAMPAGHFTVPSILSAPDWGTNDATASSSYGSLSGTVLYNSSYSLISYNDLMTLSYGTDVSYEWSGSEPVATSVTSRSVSCSFSSKSSLGSNKYSYTLSGSINDDISAPNGIFYSIIPFVVAGIIAVAGIVIFKKQSVK